MPSLGGGEEGLVLPSLWCPMGWGGLENALAGPCQLRRRAGCGGGETDPCSASVTVKGH